MRSTARKQSRLENRAHRSGSAADVRLGRRPPGTIESTSSRGAAAMLELAIVGATTVTPSGVGLSDVGISGEKIVRVAPAGALESAHRTIDAHGMILIPGAVDPHTHLDAEMFSSHTIDDFESGTIPAAAGGVTTLVDYAFQPQRGSPAGALHKWT